MYVAFKAFVRRHLASLRNHEREELKRQAREKIARVSDLLEPVLCIKGL